MDAIFRRTSVRKYLDKPVEDEKIDKILRAGMAAPSAGNQQPWEFYVVKNREVIKQLSESHQFAGCAAGAPVVIVACYKTQGLKFSRCDVLDMSACTENILIEAVELGLGAVWLAIAPLEHRIEKVKAILNLPDDLAGFAIIPIGYPASQRPQPDRYDESRIHYVD